MRRGWLVFFTSREKFDLEHTALRQGNWTFRHQQQRTRLCHLLEWIQGYGKTHLMLSIHTHSTFIGLYRDGLKEESKTLIRYCLGFGIEHSCIAH